MRNIIFVSHPFLALGTADSPGLAYLNGLISHHGKNGCRLYCSIRGHHKARCPYYYPAHTRSPDYNVEDCNHPDMDIKNPPYMFFRYLLEKLDICISKPSIFLGFSSTYTFGIPKCFRSDIMHLISLNIPDLLIPL
ncbi:hypothetical protein F4604DRAFT_1881287 [Suillus subluteus]|nr:hypothetical protein F4604DRAFT_1881287 [Suillus subluteus]